MENVKKEAFKRGLNGMPQGIAIGLLIAIIHSLIAGELMMTPMILIEQFDSAVNALIVQTLFSGLIGATFGACSVIWNMDNWSILKQTALYFGTTSIVFFPVSYFMHWMRHSLAGIALYFIIFIAIFFISWMGGYIYLKININKIKEKLEL